MVAHSFNQEAERQANLCEFEASLVYRASSRTASTVTQRNLVSKNKQTKTRNRGFGVIRS